MRFTPIAIITHIRLALSFLSRVPVGNIASPLPALHHCFWAFGCVGFGFGVGYAAIMWAGDLLGMAPLIAAVLAIAGGLILSGGLHEDGFADMTDGFGGGSTAEDKLRIMKDSYIGSFGVCALILILVMRIATLSVLSEDFASQWVMFILSLGIIAGFSRLCMAGVLIFLPPARKGGLGHEFSVKQNAAEARQNLLIGALILLICAFFAPVSVMGVLIVMVGFSMVVAQLSLRQIGGQSGDICGAVQLVSETAGWIVLSLLVF